MTRCFTLLSLLSLLPLPLPADVGEAVNPCIGPALRVARELSYWVPRVHWTGEADEPVFGWDPAPPAYDLGPPWRRLTRGPSEPCSVSGECALNERVLGVLRQGTWLGDGVSDQRLDGPLQQRSPPTVRCSFGARGAGFGGAGLGEAGFGEAGCGKAGCGAAPLSRGTFQAAPAQGWTLWLYCVSQYQATLAEGVAEAVTEGADASDLAWGTTRINWAQRVDGNQLWRRAQ